MVEKLIFLSCTRLDIKFAVSRLSQFMNNAIEEDVETIYKTLRYFKITTGQGLFFKKTTERKSKLILVKIWLSLSMIDIEPQVAAYISGEIDQLVKQEAISGISEWHM